MDSNNIIYDDRDYQGLEKYEEARKVNLWCLYDVTHPGKFEGENIYVPYFWGQYLEGAYDRDDGDILEFDVTEDDIRLFPELASRKVVAIMERDDGFVIEVEPYAT